LESSLFKETITGIKILNKKRGCNEIKK